MPRRPRTKPTQPEDVNRLVDIHTRFFATDIEDVKRIATANGLPWQVELRLIVRRAVRVHLIKER